MESLKDKPKIFFLHQSWKGFERTDCAILSHYFQVKEALLYKNFLGKTFFLLKKIYSADLVFCWFAYGRALPALLAAKMLGKKIIVVGGGWEAADMPSIDFGVMRKDKVFSLTRLAVKVILFLADKVLAVSEFNQRELQLNAGLDKEKIKLIYLGVDTSDKINQENIKKNVNLVLTVGQINEQNMSRKGLSAFVEVAGVLTSVEFVLIGGTPEMLGKYIKTALPLNLTILPFSWKVVQDYYRQAKVYVQVSCHENFGLSLAEAMSYECIPVVTDMSALPEVVGPTGYYAKYQDRESIVQAIQLALRDESKGYQARQRVEDSFSLKIREKELIELVRSVMAE